MPTHKQQPVKQLLNHKQPPQSKPLKVLPKQPKTRLMPTLKLLRLKLTKTHKLSMTLILLSKKRQMLILKKHSKIKTLHQSKPLKRTLSKHKML